jgi:hypothetical protein
MLVPAGSGAATSAVALAPQHRDLTPMLCSFVLLKSDHFKATLRALLQQVEAGTQGPTSWQMSTAAAWHSFRICAMTSDTASVASHFLRGGMAEALLAALARICADVDVSRCCWGLLRAAAGCWGRLRAKQRCCCWHGEARRMCCRPFPACRAAHAQPSWDDAAARLPACLPQQVLVADAAVRDTLELLLGVLDHCKQDLELHEPARSSPAVPAMVACAVTMREMFSGLQYKLLGCALDLAVAASAGEDSALARWPGLQDTVLDWLAGGLLPEPPLACCAVPLSLGPRLPSRAFPFAWGRRLPVARPAAGTRAAPEPGATLRPDLARPAPPCPAPAGVARGWHAPVLNDSHKGMAREQSDVLQAALTCLGVLALSRKGQRLTAQQLQHGRIGQLAAALPWPGALPEECVQLCHVQACCLQLLYGHLADLPKGEEAALLQVLDMFAGTLQLAFRVGRPPRLLLLLLLLLLLGPCCCWTPALSLLKQCPEAAALCGAHQPGAHQPGAPEQQWEWRLCSLHALAPAGPPDRHRPLCSRARPLAPPPSLAALQMLHDNLPEVLRLNAHGQLSDLTQHVFATLTNTAASTVMAIADKACLPATLWLGKVGAYQGLVDVLALTGGQQCGLGWVGSSAGWRRTRSAAPGSPWPACTRRLISKGAAGSSHAPA